MHAVIGSSHIKTIGFVCNVLLMIRMIMSTGAHPRVAIVINTVLLSLPDLFNLVIILVILFGGFYFIAVVQFGAEMESFGTATATFNSLWGVFVGGAAEGSSMLERPELFAVIALFALLACFIGLNVIIAIIVESYLIVKKEVEDLKAESNILMDIGMTIYTTLYMWRHTPWLS